MDLAPNVSATPPGHEPDPRPHWRAALKLDLQFVLAVFSAFGLASGISDISKLAYLVVHRFHQTLRVISVGLFSWLRWPTDYIPRFEQSLVYASLLIFVVRGVIKVGQTDLFRSPRYFASTALAQSFVWAVWSDHALHYSQWQHQSEVASLWGVTILGTSLFLVVFLIFSLLQRRGWLDGLMVATPSRRLLLALLIVLAPQAVALTGLALINASPPESARVAIFVLVPPLLFLNPTRLRQIAALLVAIYLLAYLCIPLDQVFDRIAAVPSVPDR